LRSIKLQRRKENELKPVKEASLKTYPAIAKMLTEAVRVKRSLEPKASKRVGPVPKPSLR
jgi:hypothetical protein